MSLTTAILLFDGAEELDFVGPWEILAAARHLGGTAAGAARDDRPYTCSAGGQPIRCAKGLRVLPDHALDDTPTPNVLLVPGGIGARNVMKDEALLAWVRRTAKQCRYVTSVCTGSMVLYAAGLARGKTVTSHASVIDEMRKWPELTVVADRRWVVDGNLVTAGGVSAGIDLALWLVLQEHGADFARAVRQYVEYFPAPPV